MNEPADSTAPIRTPSEKAKPSPTSIPSTTRPASASGSLGMCWPWSAIGARPTEIPTAIMRRDDLRGEQRRDEEQRRDPREHEDEASELVARQLAQKLRHEPTIEG